MFMEPIEPEAEDETGGETQDDETVPVEDEAEDDASEAEDEEIGEDDSDEDSDETDGDDAEPDDDDSESEPLFTVKVNGEDRQITEQELKNDYSGRAALQERHEFLKTQEGKIQQERQALMQLYQQAQATGFKPAPQKPDPAMMQTDPIGYFEAKAAYDQQVEEHQQTEAQVRYHQQQAQAQAERQMQETLAQQREILLDALPELKDPQKGKEIQKAWIETAKAYGFTGEDLNNVTVAGTFRMLDDARKWRELQAGKQAAKKPREEAKVVTRPKGKMRDGGKQAMAKKQLQAIKNGNEDAIVDWLLNP